MIRAGKAARWQEFTGQRAQATFHPVADDGAADLLGHGEPDANGFVAIGAVADEQDEPWRRGTPAGVSRQEIGAFAKGD